MSVWSERLDHMVAGRGEEETAPFLENLSLAKLTQWEPGRACFEWEIDPNMYHHHDAVFGGHLAALADRALAVVTMTVLEDGEAFTTADLRVNFFRPVTKGCLRLEATVVHRGRRMVQAEVTFTLDDNKLSNKATATQVILPEAER